MYLGQKVWQLSEEYENQNQEVKSRCFLETLMKGCFSLISVKYPRGVLKLAACTINLFFKIFEKLRLVNPETPQPEFKKSLNYMYEAIRGLLILAKEGQNDIIFKQEGLI